MKVSTLRLQQRNSGFTVIELLVATTISMLIVGAALTTILSSRSLFIKDQERTSTNQNARAAMTIVGSDIQLAGERLGGESSIVVPAIEITNGSDLILRRSVLDTVLPICSTDSVGTLSAAIPVAIKPPLTGKLAAYPGCSAIDADSDGNPDNWEAWQAYRTSEGGTVRAYLYNPTRKVGEFVTYRGESRSGSGSSTFNITSASATFTYKYPVEEYPSLYLIEERRYILDGDVLELTINGESANSQSVVGDLKAFQAAAVVADTAKTTFTKDDDWKKIESVELSTTGANNRQFKSSFFPRNILSY